MVNLHFLVSTHQPKHQVLRRIAQNFANVDTLRYKNYFIIPILSLFR